MCLATKFALVIPDRSHCQLEVHGHGKLGHARMQEGRNHSRNTVCCHVIVKATEGDHGFNYCVYCCYVIFFSFLIFILWRT